MRWTTIFGFVISGLGATAVFFGISTWKDWMDGMILDDLAFWQKALISLGVGGLIFLVLAFIKMVIDRRRKVQPDDQARQTESLRAKPSLQLRFLSPVTTPESFHLPIINDSDVILEKCLVKITGLRQNGKEYHTPIAISSPHDQSKPDFSLHPHEEKKVYIARRIRNANIGRMRLEFLHPHKEETIRPLEDGEYEIEIEFYSELGPHKQAYLMRTHERTFEVESREETNPK